MKTYVLTVSRYFAATHKRKGSETFFLEKILSELVPCGLLPKQEQDRFSPFNYNVFTACIPKIHTIRANYTLWQNRFDEIKAGRACLSLRYWSEKPYRSKQVEFARLTREDGIGLQELKVDAATCVIDGEAKQMLLPETIANNDGLSIDDWREWFRSHYFSKPMAIIHFTKFRY